jgi:hypothetical protein
MMGIWRGKKEGGEQRWCMEVKYVLKEGRDKVRRDREIVKREKINIARRKRYTVKKVIVFPVPRRDVTNQTLPGREKFNYSRAGRVWLLTFRLGTGKSLTFFHSAW